VQPILPAIEAIATHLEGAAHLVERVAVVARDLAGMADVFTFFGSFRLGTVALCGNFVNLSKLVFSDNRQIAFSKIDDPVSSIAR
jgi:hypothetical protein